MHNAIFLVFLVFVMKVISKNKFEASAASAVNVRGPGASAVVHESYIQHKF